MRCLTVVLALGCALTLNAQKNEQKQDERVRAKEPTVVTVYGQRENVEGEKAPQPDRNAVEQVGHGLRTGAVAVGKGIVSFAGWLANVDEVIPKRKNREQQRDTQP